MKFFFVGACSETSHQNSVYADSNTYHIKLDQDGPAIAGLALIAILLGLNDVLVL